MTIIDHSRPTSDLQQIPSAGLAAAMSATYRITPDRRVLLAAADIDKLARGSQPKVDLSIQDDRWSIDIEGRHVGDMSDVPTFADGLELLTRWAVAEHAKGVATVPPSVLAEVDHGIVGFYSSSLLHASALIDKATGGKLPDGAGLTRLVRASTRLNLQTIDHAGVSDPVRARALALLAINRSFDPTCCASEAALLAESMGYEREAEVMARRLPANDIARATILGTDIGGQSPIALYISTRYSVRKARRADLEDMLNKSALPLRSLPLFLNETDFENVEKVSVKAARVVADEVAGAGDLDAPIGSRPNYERDPRELFKQFESSIRKRASEAASAFIPSDVVEAHYSALFYSALYEYVRFGIEQFAEEGTARTAAAKTSGGVTPIGRQFHAWMSFWISTKFNAARDVDPPHLAVRKLPYLGAAQSASLALEYARALGANNPSVRQAIREIVTLLDSRPQEMFLAGRLVNWIPNPPLYERYCGTAIDRARSIEAEGWRATFYTRIGNAARLREISSSPDDPPTDRAVALDGLAALGRNDDAWVRSKFEELLAKYGYEDVYTTYVRFLNDRHDWKTKEAAVRRWFSKYAASSNSSIEEAYFASSLANALEQQGRYEEAWRVVEPHIGVWSENILASAVSLLQRRGEAGKAIELGRRMVERYPGAAARADLARVLWRERKYSDAAALFDQRRAQYRSSDYYEYVPRAFVETFYNAEVTEPIAAFEAMMKVGLPSQYLNSIAKEFLKADKPEAAAAIAVKLAESRPLAAIAPVETSDHIEAWRALKAWKGVEAANAWLQTRVPDDATVQFVIVAYQMNEHELVWSFAKPRPNAIKNVEVQSILAASLVHMRAVASDPRHIALVNQVRSQNAPDDSLRPAAEYLLGLIDEATFYGWAKDTNGKSTLAYFVGLKRASAHDYDGALPWLLAAAEGPANIPPTAWAIEMLHRFSNGNVSWADVKSKGML